MGKNKLRTAFDKAVTNYVAALLEMYEWDAYYGYWVGDDTTGIYAYGDCHFLTLSNIIYIVDNDVPLDVFEEWDDYCLWAHEFNQRIPNLDSWVKGCPRESKEEMEALRTAKQDFENQIQELKDKIEF